GWRYAFLALGGVGVAAALLVLTVVREPPRGGLDHHHDKTASASGFAQTAAMFFSTPSLVLAALASGVTQIATYGAGNCSTLFLMREKGMSLSEVAVYLALAAGFGMGGGIFVSGRVIDRFTRRSKQAYALIPALSLALALPFYLAFVAAPTWQLGVLFIIG